MSADIHYKGTMDAKQVHVESEKLIKQGRRLGASFGTKSGKRGSAGLAFLEGTRAIEDFTMAGMRGAINNIPGLVMNLGAGAGLAGAVSLVTVAAWKASEALQAMMDSAQAAFEREQEIGLAFIGKEAEFTSEKLRELKTQAQDTFSELSKGIQQQVSLDQAKRTADETVEKSAQNVKNQRELLDLRKSGASEAEIELKTLEQQGRAIQENFDRLNKGNLDSRKNLDMLRQKEEANQKIIEKGAEERAKRDRIIAQAREATQDERRRREGGMENVEQNEFFQTAKENRGLTREVEERIKKAAEAEEQARRENDLIVEQIQAEERSARIQAEQNAAKKEQLKDQGALIELQKEELALSQAIAQKEAEKALAQSMAVTPDGLLSSAGRSGLGATEALNALNIQKSMLSVLKKIERNTQGDKISLAG